MHPGICVFSAPCSVFSQRYPTRAWVRYLFLLAAALASLPGAVGAAGATEVIHIGTLPGLRFDTGAFSVRPGSDVEVVFSNYDEMLHNFVVVKPGSRERVVQAALALATGAAEKNFVPDSPDVLWASKVVPAGQSVTLKLTAPAALGEYPYVCTFPGHGILMFGTMIVTNTPQPAVMNPVSLPKPPARTGAPATSPDGMDHAQHAGTPTAATAARAVTMRAFMPNSGPAAIAVQLPGGVSYCWDAGAGRFRYAWTGGYMTMPAAAERGLAKIQGEVFYTEPAYPLRLGAAPGTEPKQIDFKGYTLDAQRIPEFETVVDGVTVRERAEVRDGKLVRRFRTSGEATVWFAIPAENAGLDAPSGTKAGAFYRFAGEAAKEFTIIRPIPVSSTP